MAAPSVGNRTQDVLKVVTRFSLTFALLIVLKELNQARRPKVLSQRVPVVEDSPHVIDQNRLILLEIQTSRQCGLPDSGVGFYLRVQKPDHV